MMELDGEKAELIKNFPRETEQVETKKSSAAK